MLSVAELTVELRAGSEVYCFTTLLVRHGYKKFVTRWRIISLCVLKSDLKQKFFPYFLVTFFVMVEGLDHRISKYEAIFSRKKL